MKYNPKIHKRRSIRLKGYDYSQAGLYFITICLQNRACLFGDVIDGEMNLNEAGTMVEDQWTTIPERFINTKLHEYIVMPNHFHAILEITVGSPLVVDQNETDNGIIKPELGQPQGIAPTESQKNKKTLGDIVGAFESITTVEYIRGVKSKNWQRFNKKLWQRNYWEHIIRNEFDYYRIANYIIENPKKWEEDKLNPGNK